jgi:GTP-binding protein
MKSIVAIIGRPNVGKSTLFNRLTRSRKALVDDFPGVTRDRIYGDAKWGDLEFTVVDTGGFSEFENETFAPLIRFQVMQAMEEADAIVMLFDGREGVNPVDAGLVQKLRQSDKPVLYAVNKIDGPRHEGLLADFASLGVDPLYPISAEHRYGMDDFMDALTRGLPQTTLDSSEAHIRLAVIGRPNVGKSSLINRLLGDERLVVSDQPGTTRDSVDLTCKVKGKEYLLIDTAGIRRKKQVKKKLEKFSIMKALRSLNKCHIALIMLDAETGITDQDVRIAGYAWERGRACIILLNKWDLIEKDVTTADRYLEAVKERFKFLSFAPTMTISALTGQRTFKIFDWVEKVHEQYTRRVTTGQLNRIIETIVSRNEPSMFRGRRIKFYYSTQTYVGPPSFVCFVNSPEGIHFSYKRYVTNQLREALALDKTPIRVTFRKRKQKQKP